MKEVNSCVDEVNVNFDNVKGRLVGIEDNVENISEGLRKANRDLNAMSADQKSSNITLKTTVEKQSKAFEAKFLQIGSEVKNLQDSHEESSKTLAYVKVLAQTIK